MTEFPQLTTEVLENEKAVLMQTTLGDIKNQIIPRDCSKNSRKFLNPC